MQIYVHHHQRVITLIHGMYYDNIKDEDYRWLLETCRQSCYFTFFWILYYGLMSTICLEAFSNRNIHCLFALVQLSVQFQNGQAKELPRGQQHYSSSSSSAPTTRFTTISATTLSVFSGHRPKTLQHLNLWNTPSRFHQTNTHAFRHNLKRVPVLLTKLLTDWWQNEMIVGLN